MATNNPQSDLLEYDDFGKPKMPSGINILTILTFIGCAIGFIGAIYSFFSIQNSYANREKLMEQLSSDQMPAFAKALMGDPKLFIEMITKSYENRIPVLISSLLATGLCFFGALQMRGLKKQGYLLYVIGEILPFITNALFIGVMAISGTGAFIGMGIAALFILLYTFQRKYLVNP